MTSNVQVPVFVQGEDQLQDGFCSIMGRIKQALFSSFHHFQYYNLLVLQAAKTDENRQYVRIHDVPIAMLWSVYTYLN